MLLLIWLPSHATSFVIAQVDLNPPAASGSVSPRQFSVLEKPPNSRHSPTALAPLDAGETIDRLVTRLALENMPHHYHDDKNWGKQDKRWDGVNIKRDGLRLKTKRRWKTVNHGTWRKYSIELLNPKEEFTIQLKNLHQTSTGQLGFDVHFTAHLKLNARQSKWVKGLQLYSVSAAGHAKVRLRVQFEMDTSLDLKQLPPALIFSPHANSASLHIDEFHLDRVSKLGGEFSQQLGKQVRKILEEKVAEKQDKLVQKVNRGIQKNKSKLRLSLNKALKSKWSGQVAPLLPNGIRQAMEASQTQTSKSTTAPN